MKGPPASRVDGQCCKPPAATCSAGSTCSAWLLQIRHLEDVFWQLGCLSGTSAWNWQRGGRVAYLPPGCKEPETCSDAQRWIAAHWQCSTSSSLFAVHPASMPLLCWSYCLLTHHHCLLFLVAQAGRRLAVRVNAVGQKLEYLWCVLAASTAAQAAAEPAKWW
jgi:hypothetical protein